MWRETTEPPLIPDTEPLAKRSEKVIEEMSNLDMLSGEQAELFPVEMLVSMLSELSRLMVS